MTEKQKVSLLNRLNDYKDHLITNMTDKELYNDCWKISDINRLNKDLRFIKKLIKYAIIFVMAYLVITKIVPWGLKFNMYGTDKFDSKLWIKEWERIEIQATKSNDKSHKYVHYRCSMYNDVMKNHLKKGMKLKEVTDMLGDYRSVDYCTNKKVKCISYTLGSCL